MPASSVHFVAFVFVPRPMPAILRTLIVGQQMLATLHTRRPMPANVRTLFVWQPISVSVNGAGNNGYEGNRGNVLQKVQS